MRRFAHLLPALCLLTLAAAPQARAQVSVYATVAPVRVSNIVNGNTVGLNPTYTYGSYWTTGVGGGVTVNFLPLPIVSLGLDVRGSTRPGTNGTDTAMAGLKLGARLPLVHLKPYIEAAGGYIGTRTAATVNGVVGTDTQRWAGYEVLGGVDAHLLGPLDFRVIEIGGGTGMLIKGPNTNVRNIDLLTINSGLVLHF